MGEPASPLRRRALLVAGYALTTGLLLHAVARDLPWIEAAFADLASLLPELLRGSEPSAILAILALSLAGTLAAAGTLWLSRRTGTGFGLLAVATAAWAVFPYSRVPWTRLLGGPPGQTYAAPASVWIPAGILVALATMEICFCSRQNLLAELDRRGLPTGPESLARQATGASLGRWLVSSLLAATLIVLLFAGLHPVAAAWAGGLDLLWVPAIAGLVAGIGIWLWAR